MLWLRLTLLERTTVHIVIVQDINLSSIESTLSYNREGEAILTRCLLDLSVYSLFDVC